MQGVGLNVGRSAIVSSSVGKHAVSVFPFLTESQLFSPDFQFTSSAFTGFRVRNLERVGVGIKGSWFVLLGFHKFLSFLT